MKKILASILIASSAFAQTDELKKYWDTFYTEIKSCILDKYKSKNLYKPEFPIKDTMDLKIYLKALDYTGYVVYIDTKNFTESDICFMKYLAKKLGYFPKYYSPAEILVIQSFDRQVDAVSLKQKLENLFPKKQTQVNPKDNNVVKEKSPVFILNLD